MAGQREAPGREGASERHAQKRGCFRMACPEERWEDLAWTGRPEADVEAAAQPRNLDFRSEQHQMFDQRAGNVARFMFGGCDSSPLHFFIVAVVCVICVHHSTHTCADRTRPLVETGSLLSQPLCIASSSAPSFWPWSFQTLVLSPPPCAAGVLGFQMFVPASGFFCVPGVTPVLTLDSECSARTY